MSNWTRRTLSVILACVLLGGAVPMVSVMPLAASSSSKFLAPIEPWEAGSTAISTRAQLEAIKNNLNGKFHLTKDIDLTGAEWVPIGANVNNRFTGVFDGQGHVISNLKITGAGYENTGLFGYSSGTIKNVGMEGVSIVLTPSSNAYAGAVCGTGGYIYNCYNTGKVSVTGSNSGYLEIYTGGIGGSVSSISYCFNTGDISASTSGAEGIKAIVGGIAGATGTAINSYNVGKVSATAYTSSTSSAWNPAGYVTAIAHAGGIAGDNNSVDECYNTGSVTSFSESVMFTDSAHAGGISGSGTQNNCFNTGTVSATASYPYAGGIAGSIARSACYNYNLGIVNVSARMERCIGGIVAGVFNFGSVVNSYALDLYGSQDGTQRTSSQMKNRANFENWNFSTIWDIDPAVNSGYPFLRNIAVSGGDVPSNAELSVWSESSVSYLRKGDTRKYYVGIIENNQFLPGDHLNSISVAVANSAVANITSIKNIYDCIEITVKGVNIGSTFVTVSDSNKVGYFPIHVYEQDENCYFNGNVPDFWQSGMFVSDFKSEKKSNGDYIFSMDIYNQECNHGALEVYDADGNQKESIMISAFNDGYVTSIKETIASYTTLATAIWDGNLTDIKSETYAKKTSVSVTVPKDGYIRISNDMLSSNSCLLYNCVDVAVSAISKAVSLGLGDKTENVKAKMAEEINNELLKKAGKQVNTALKTLIKETSKNASYLDTKSIFTAFAGLLECLSLDYKTILVSSAKDYGINIAEGLLLNLVSYGWVVKSIFEITSVIKIGKMIDACNKNAGSGYASIYAVQTGNTRISNGVKAESIFDVQTILRTFVVTLGDMHDDIAQAMNAKLYDITLVRDGQEIQPTSTVKVYIPIPDEGWAWFNIDNLYVYRVVRNGSTNSYERLESRIEGSYIVFETDRFSYYMVTDNSNPTSTATKYVGLFRWRTNYVANFRNWFKFIFLFGWLWMWFI